MKYRVTVELLSKDGAVLANSVHPAEALRLSLVQVERTWGLNRQEYDALRAAIAKAEGRD